MRQKRTQTGQILLPWLLVFSLLGAYSLLQGSQARSKAEEALHERLQQAREALIARAVTDANRPGSLPCPDLMTDDNGLSNHPNDGKADNLTRNDCPAYAGWLPWVTLDLPELHDESGTRFWYVLSRSLRDDDLAQPINSATRGGLSLDTQDDIAALIIAPGAAQAGQQRPSNSPGDYLDGLNAQAGTRYFSHNTDSAINDIFLPISRRELMAAVEKRVASEVLACLEQHITAVSNRLHTTPWPAPFSAPTGAGKSGSYFGQIPLSQPGAGIQMELTERQQQLETAALQLRTAATPAAQLSALTTLAEQVNLARVFYDRLFAVMRDLALLARNTGSQLSALDLTLSAANSNGRISVTEKRNIQSDADSLLNLLPGLQTPFHDSGLDVFPDEYALRQRELQNRFEQAAGNPGSSQLSALSNAGNALYALLVQSTTKHDGINAALSQSSQLGAQSLTAQQEASAAPGDSAKTAKVLELTGAWLNSGNKLLDSIDNNRSQMHDSEIQARADALTQILGQIDASDSPTLRAELQTSASLLRQINPSAGDLAPLVERSLSALAAAGTASTTAQTISNTQASIDRLRELAETLRTRGDNLSDESLGNASAAFSRQLGIFNTVSTRTQAEMVPYAENLRRATVDLQFWAEIISRQSALISTQARKSPDAGKTQNNPASAYTLADNTLNSINKSTGSLKKVQDWADAPTSASKQTAASAALADTQNALDQLIAANRSLSALTHSTPADAFPTLWHSSRCNFLQPGTDNTSWWLANQWSSTLFYQISQRQRGSNGRLRVNGRSGYHTVVISAGAALSIQDRQNRRSDAFFEAENAHPSRDGNASAPVPDFSSRGGLDFNDRLAY